MNCFKKKAEKGLSEKDLENVYGEICIRKQRRKRQKILVIELLLDYAKNSTLHGLRYITERGLSIVEKIFWLFTFAISIVLCFTHIQDVFTKWTKYPAVYTISQRIIPVGMVPFPSVTICPQIKCMASKYNFTEEYEKHLNINETQNSYTTDSFNKLEDVKIICDQGDIINFVPGNFSIDHINEVSPDASDVFFRCLWRKELVHCEEIFKRVLTSEGVCYNFNSLSADEIFYENVIQRDYRYLENWTPTANWDLQNGYTNYNIDSYPRYGLENGPIPDLDVILMESVEERDSLCNSLNKGHKIYIQHPADMPQASLHHFAVMPKQASSLALKFNFINAIINLKDSPADLRQCYYPWERPLRYFRIYTPNNCRLECQSNFTYEQCECVWFHMPHNDSRDICTFESKKCVHDAQVKISIRQINDNKNPTGCTCFPNCNSINYDAEIQKTEFDFETYMKSHELVHNIDDKLAPGVEFSKVVLYFKEPYFVAMERFELMSGHTFTEFLAECGGLLGLFLGFSFLSLIEIVYFVTLRLFYTLRRDLQQEREARKFSTIEELRKPKLSEAANGSKSGKSRF